MRLWSIHPKYLDRSGLIALWREALLAQKVLEGKTKGYKNHPQIIRFKNTCDPMLMIGTYLYFIFLESIHRGYKFDVKKIKKFNENIKNVIPVKEGQIKYEFLLLKRKLGNRDKNKFLELHKINYIELNPIFYKVKGGLESWEKPKLTL
jgi:hypothetical protein